MSDQDETGTATAECPHHGEETDRQHHHDETADTRHSEDASADRDPHDAPVDHQQRPDDDEQASGCPHHDASEPEQSESDEGEDRDPLEAAKAFFRRFGDEEPDPAVVEARAGDLPRRSFVKGAVAVGGSAALSACTSLLDGEDSVPTGRDDLSTLPERQHAWNEYLPTDDHGNVVAPRHRVLLLLDYAGDGTPTDDDRETVESALRSLERAYERSNEGLIFTISYSHDYFGRFDATLPESVDLPEPAALSPFEDPKLDRPDAVVHLASDRSDVVLAADEALQGERDAANGVEMEASLEGVFEVVDRRTGFIGDGLPAENQDVEGIPEGDPVPEDAPLFMGFKSGFEKNQASEDRVTIQKGPFAEGTTQHLSKLRLRLEDWYDEQDREDRVAEMFCPFHAENDVVEGAGDNLGNSSKIDDCKDIDEAASEFGRIGHSQKTAKAREDDSPIILRRDFDSTDGGEAGLHFLSVQREISDFVDTRKAMNGTEHTDNPAIRQRVNNGILEYVFTQRRGNYLVPPRSHRALPTPRPE